jgi:hypothetical protein
MALLISFYEYMLLCKYVMVTVLCRWIVQSVWRAASEQSGPTCRLLEQTDTAIEGHFRAGGVSSRTLTFCNASIKCNN